MTIVTDPRANKTRKTFPRWGPLVGESRGFESAASATWTYEVDPNEPG